MTNLEKLNKILSNGDVKIADFRRHVDATGRNLKWLQRNFARNPEAPEELRRLLSLNLNELVKGETV